MEVIVFIFNLIIAVIFKLVQIIIAPIDWIIEQYIPNLDDAFNAIADFLNVMAQGIGWAISSAGIPFTAIALIATYWIFKLTLPLNVYFIKLALKWYRAIRA